MSKRRIIKAYQGLQFGSSPLTSLNPIYSASQGPNYNNALSFGWKNPLGFDVQAWGNKMDQQFQSQKFKMGLGLMGSSDQQTRDLGNQWMLEGIDGMNWLLFSSNGGTSAADPNEVYSADIKRLTGIDWSAAAGQAGQVIGNAVGGAAGAAISKATGVVGNIKNLQELYTLSKAGVKGLGTAKVGNIAAIGGAVADIASSFLPEKTEYAGAKGGITQTIDSVYDGISDAAMSFGPIGMMVGGIMKGGKLLGGVINGFGGKKAETITKNDLAFEQVGASYTGTGGSVDDALQKSGKKYGLFSSGERKKANEEILEARRQQSIMSDIANNASDRFSIRNSMAAINGNRRRFHIQGGYDQSAVRVGRHGMIIQDLQRARRINNATKYQKGGKVSDPFESYLQTLPENQRDSTDFRVKDYWEFNGKPKNFDEAVFRGMFTRFDDGWHANSVAENPNTGEIEFMKSSSHPSIQKELDWYNSDDASEFRSQYELQKTEPYFKYVKRKGTDSPQSFKEGGNLIKSDWLVEVDINNLSIEFRGSDIEEVDVDNILPEFKEGGKFNLIPEGALHARKHNMDVEGITPKGIPVVSYSKGEEIEQQAEIEREEIIFRLEVTKKLEELAKDGSDEAAIEAGKLLVEEILYNTIDNTNNLI